MRPAWLQRTESSSGHGLKTSKSFQESFETHGLQRLHTQNTAAGSNVLCWTVFRGNVLLQLWLYSKLFTGSCGKLLLYCSVVWFLYSFTVSPHIICDLFNFANLTNITAIKILHYISPGHHLVGALWPSTHYLPMNLSDSPALD